MNVPDRYEVIVNGTGNYRRAEIVFDLEDVISVLRKYRWYATDAQVTVTEIRIVPSFLDQAPIPGMVR